jgi:hypothetical protein
METDTLHLLSRNIGDEEFGALAVDAIALINSSAITGQGAAAQTQSSKVVADIWDRRRNGPKFKGHAFQGLDATICSLRKTDSEVRGFHVETKAGFVVVWTDDKAERILGLITGRYLHPQT